MLLYNDDCFNAMKQIEDGSVDLILTDPPYGITQNSWDKIPALDRMWGEFNRLIKNRGAIVITAAQPFASKLIMSNIDNFKYDIIWEKTVCSGQLNIKRQPLRAHEHILVFYQNSPTYNEQLTAGEPYKIKRKAAYANKNYGNQVDSEKTNNGFRHARSVIKISNPRIRGGHPTEKPVALMSELVKTYSNRGGLVLDPFMGSGSTGEACIDLARDFIGIELDEKYFKKAKSRLRECLNRTLE
jgi:site-specific DNA-methyltransferase (adenine-specific)